MVDGGVSYEDAIRSVYRLQLLDTAPLGLIFPQLGSSGIYRTGTAGGGHGEGRDLDQRP